jgi:hypothetical protein
MRTLALSLVLVVGCVGAAEAQTPDRCRIVDPTGTPLNLRSGPNGAVIGTIGNGRLVRYLKDEDDDRGRTWVQIAPWSGQGSGRPLGWVFREFIACF